MNLDYSNANLEIGQELREAHAFLWQHLSKAGSWWTGAERIAIAREARHAPECRLCIERKTALSPEQVSGAHDPVEKLPAPLIEVIHRVRTDPARLSKSWFEKQIDGGIRVEQYIEAIGVITLSIGVEMFCRAIGVPPFPFPQPQNGTPNRYRPAKTTSGIAWVPMLQPESASGAESDLYAGIEMVPNIMRALSLVPNEARALQRSSDAHYVPVAKISDPSVRRSLDRMQMELIASRVSAINECFY